MSSFNCQSYEINNNSYINDDILISKLNNEICQKERNKKDFFLLQSKYRNLLNEFQILSDAKHQLEKEFNLKIGNNSQLDIKNENEKLSKELKEKISMNNKLYNENNTLFTNLETTIVENKKLKEKLFKQGNNLSKLNSEKDEMEKQITELNKIKEDNTKNIENLNNKINNLTQTSNNQNKLLNETNIQNNEVVKQLKLQEYNNNNLKDKLKIREDALMKAQEQLNNLNERINKLKSDYDILNHQYKKNRLRHAKIHDKIDKEKARQIIVNENNKKLEGIVNDTDEEIKNIENENKSFETDLEELGKYNIFLGKHYEAYKRQILILTEQNDKLSKELERILDRDEELLMNLRRNEKLKCVVAQNKHFLQNELTNLKVLYNIENLENQNKEMNSQNNLIESQGYNNNNNIDTS